MILVKIQFDEMIIHKKYNIFQSLKEEMLIRIGQFLFFCGKMGYSEIPADTVCLPKKSHKKK